MNFITPQTSLAHGLWHIYQVMMLIRSMAVDGGKDKQSTIPMQGGKSHSQRMM
jgi:hypothetical protein